MRTARSDIYRRWASTAALVLVAYGTMLIFLQTDAVLKLARGLMGYAGWIEGGIYDLPTAWSAPTDIDEPVRGLYGLLSAHQPLLPWAAWVAGVILLFLVTGERTQSAQASEATGQADLRASARVMAFALGATGLLVPLALGVWLRAEHLLPTGGQWPGSNYDEMVYYTQAELLVRGVWAYRDTFMAHPPGVVWAFAPGLIFERAWGGAGAFVAARQWLLFYSGTAIPLAWLCARRLGGLWSAGIAALVVALDGKAAFAPESDRQLPNVGILETLVNASSLAALAVYLYAPERPAARKWWLLASGALAGVAAMCKAPGIALLGGLIVYSLALRRFREALLVLTGGLAGGFVLALPFLLVAPGQMVRQAIFFQLLRPQEVKEGLDQAARIAAYPEAQVTFLLAGLGVLVIGWLLWGGWRGAGQEAQSWVLAALWAAPVAAVFVVSRSFHSQYYTQWVAPLALIAGATAAQQLWQRRTAAKLAVAGIVVLLLVPLLVSQWRVDSYTTLDTVYQPAGQVVASMLGPGKQAMAFDPGYTFAAGVPPARNPGDGDYAVDTAGYTVYVAQEIDRAPWSSLVGRVFQFNRVRDESEVLVRPEAQAALLAAAVGSQAVVLDQKIALPKLTAQSVWLLEGLSTQRKDIDYASVLTMGEPLVHSLGGLPLRLEGATLARLGDNTKPVVGQGIVQAASQDAIQLGLYWRPEAYPSGNYRVVVRIVGTDGSTRKQADTEPDEGTQHTASWRPGLLYPDLRNIPLSGVAPGDYKLFVRVYDPQSQAASAEVPIEPALRVK